MDKTSPEPYRFNQKYWQEQIARRAYYNPNIEFEKYRTALEYGESSRLRLGSSVKNFNEAAKQLAEGWAAHHAATGLSWEEVRTAVEDAWQRADELVAEAVASKAHLDKPPTFLEHGRLTPRNVDESNY